MKKAGERLKQQGVSLSEIIKKFDLKQVNDASVEGIAITSPELNRIGLQLTGFLDGFTHERIQLVGMVEWRYIKTLTDEKLTKVLTDIMKKGIPCIIFSRNLEIPDVFIKLGNQFGIPILSTSRNTTKFVADLLKYVDANLAEKTTIHGVLLDINGVGTMILGKSGIGKSEIALELVKRGHRFVADDAIEITKLNDNTLMGKAPELIKNFMEIRGIGIVDMSKMYGIGSVRDSIRIDLLVKIEEWSEHTVYDRLGLDEKYMEILEKQLPLLVLPVKPGRNLAVLLEAAARNHSLKRMGFNAAKELDEKLRGKML